MGHTRRIKAAARRINKRYLGNLHITQVVGVAGMHTKEEVVMSDDWLEKQIKKAQEAGSFDNLKGKGRPMSHLDTDPLDQVLKAQGFKSRWSDLEEELREKIETAERALQRSHAWALDRLSGDSADRMLAHDEWRKARRLFRERLDEINKLIRTFNLVLPPQLVHLQRFPLKEEEELQRLCPDSHQSFDIH